MIITLNSLLNLKLVVKYVIYVRWIIGVVKLIIIAVFMLGPHIVLYVAFIVAKKT